MATINGDAGQVSASAKADRINALEENRAMAIDRAEPNELSEGDFVQWDSSGGPAQGRIENVIREGSLNVPATEFSIEASAEDPAALIRIYSEGDEGWEATETMVGAQVFHTDQDRIIAIAGRSVQAQRTDGVQ